MSTRDVYILRTGAEVDTDGQLHEALFTTDTQKLRIRSGGASEFASFPSDRTTGEFSYNANLVFLGMKIGAGSTINGTTIGAQSRAAGNFTKTLLDNGADNTSILQLKSSSVSHNHANIDDANTYGQFLRYGQETGGLFIKGASETLVGMALEATVPLSTASSDQTGAGRGIIEVIASATSGGDLTDISGQENVMAVMKRNANNTLTPVALLTAEGNWILGGTSSNNVLDDYDDVKLVEGLRAMMSADPKVREQFADSVTYALPVLKENKIIQVSKDGQLVNFDTKNAMVLLMDAIRQLKALFDEQKLVAA
jgi:hypothetical protein